MRSPIRASSPEAGLVKGLLSSSLVISALTLGSPSPARSIVDRPGPDSLLAVVGATVIDGNGGAPIPDATIVIRGNRIERVGPSSAVTVPAGATVIDARGKFVTPGFVDVNVHLSFYQQTETSMRYGARAKEVALRTAQTTLAHGVTTVRDGYGQLTILREARDLIDRGEAIGSRILVGGNVVGWNGPCSLALNGNGRSQPPGWYDSPNDQITEGTGVELHDMTPAELDTTMIRYLNKGVDFVGIGVTMRSNLMPFSPRQLEALMREARRRALPIEAHASTPEALYLAMTSGITRFQHPEVSRLPLTEEILGMLGDLQVRCATAPAWAASSPNPDSAQRVHDSTMAVRRTLDSLRADSARRTGRSARKKTEAERARETAELRGDVVRKNLLRLVKGACSIAIGSESYVGGAPAYVRSARTDSAFMPGVATVQSIIGLVRLGMTPSQAITAATKHGAIFGNIEKDLGTIEAGKIADLVILDADPLAAIENVRKIHRVIKDGRAIDLSSLPTPEVWEDQ